MYKFADPFWFWELCGSAFEAYFTKEDSSKKKEPETLPEVVWVIGPGGYERGR